MSHLPNLLAPSWSYDPSKAFTSDEKCWLFNVSAFVIYWKVSFHSAEEKSCAWGRPWISLQQMKVGHPTSWFTREEWRIRFLVVLTIGLLIILTRSTNSPFIATLSNRAILAKREKIHSLLERMDPELWTVNNKMKRFGQLMADKLNLIHELVMVQEFNMRKICTKLVRKALTDDQKAQRVEVRNEIRETKSFLWANRLICGDGIHRLAWAGFIVFFDAKGGVRVEYLPAERLLPNNTLKNRDHWPCRFIRCLLLAKFWPETG